MAARRFTSQFSYSFEKQLVRAMAKVVAGSQASTGTYTITQAKGQNMTITRTGTGLLTITLPNKYKGLVGFNVNVGRSGSATGLNVEVVTDSIASAGTIAVRIVAGTTLTDLSSGDILFVSIDLSNA